MAARRKPASGKRIADRQEVRRPDLRMPSIPGDADERRWQQLQRELQYWWGRLTDRDVLKIAGRRDELLAMLHEKYGYTPAQASRELDTALHTKPRKRRP